MEILVTVPFGDDFLRRISGVDPRLRVREATQPLRQFLRGELPEEPEAIRAAERDAADPDAGG